MIRVLVAFATASLLSAIGFNASAEYPEQPIKVIVPFNPGGGTDTTAQLFKRVIEENKLLPQPIVTVHVPGAGGNIGAKQALNAEPDGYTFLQHVTNLAANQAMGNIDFGPLDFEPVALAGDTCMMAAVVLDDSKYRSLDQLLADAKARPDQIVLGVNIGGVGHITAKLLERASPGARFRIANVGGGAKQFAAIMGGHVEVNPFSSADYSRFAPKGLRALAYTGEARHPNFPDIPTTSELGYPAVQFCFGQMWFAPKDTPQDRIDTFANALEKAFHDPLVQKRWAELAMTPNFLKGDAFRERINRDVSMIKRVFASQ